MRRFFDKYIFVAPGSDYGRAMWADLEHNEKCLFFDYPIISNNRCLKLAHHIHFSFGVNNYIKLPLQSLWKKYYTISQVQFDSSLNYCIILPDVSACRIDINYLADLSHRENIKLILVNVNVIGKKKNLIEERMDLFYKVFSFDRDDCEKYGCVYHPTIYSIHKHENVTLTNTDAFFIGSYTPERYKKILSLYKMIKSVHGKADFHIVGIPRNKKKIEGINYNKPLPYEEVIKRIQHTNCVVEIMNKGQAGLTLRAMEAICYNKKLFTDNETVKELKYYNKGFIEYCQCIEEADINFVLKRDKVDYQYEGDFSPDRLIERIEELINEGKL